MSLLKIANPYDTTERTLADEALNNQRTELEKQLANQKNELAKQLLEQDAGWENWLAKNAYDRDIDFKNRQLDAYIERGEDPPMNAWQTASAIGTTSGNLVNAADRVIGLADRGIDAWRNWTRDSNDSPTVDYVDDWLSDYDPPEIDFNTENDFLNNGFRI